MRGLQTTNGVCSKAIRVDDTERESKGGRAKSFRGALHTRPQYSMLSESEIKSLGARIGAGRRPGRRKQSTKQTNNKIFAVIFFLVSFFKNNRDTNQFPNSLNTS